MNESEAWPSNGGGHPMPGASGVTVSMRRYILSALLAAMLLAGCVGSVPIVPHARVAYVPRPMEVETGTPAEDLLEMYSVSPILDPDGWGVLDALYEQSRMTLVTWEFVRQLEERNRAAYARSDEAHAEVLQVQRAKYAHQLVFEGFFLGDREPLLDTESYRPEGIYLVDDRGRKFLPLQAESLEPLLARSMATYRLGRENFTTHRSYPLIVCPGNAITPATRAVTLYFAQFQKRFSFTWVFDPEYKPPVLMSRGLRGNRGNRLRQR